MTLKIKWHISPFLKVGFENFFGSPVQNYIGKLKNWQSGTDLTDCKNE